MSVCIVKIHALEALAALIGCEIPELEGHTCVDVPAGEMETVPNLSIEAGRWTFDPEQEAEHAILPGNRVVYDVGDHVAPCVISIVTATPAQRRRLEAEVIDLFLRQKHPVTGWPLVGVIMIPISACPDVAQWVCGFDLDSEEWMSHKLDRRYESRIMITATVPALTVDRAVYTLNQLRLGLQAQDAKPIDEAAATAPIELVTINDDGTISPAT